MFCFHNFSCFILNFYCFTHLTETQTHVCVSHSGLLQTLFLSLSGIHTYQMMVGCEWDDDTGVTNGFWQYSYDGEDFVAFDLKTLTWIAPTPQAVITKHKWEGLPGNTEYRKNYLTQECIDWLKKYVDYGRMSLLQKTPSSPVTCHASGFYPNKIMLFWRRDGEEVHEDVDHGEILHNHDGTFQKSVDLDVSSVKAEDWGRYSCVFQLSGVNEDIVTKLDPKVIKTNWGRTEIKRDGGGKDTFLLIVLCWIISLFIILSSFM
uniref:Ig-like domain-containing protein n=1 Tax=Myripristis murdjan TaxID=586833 RepID=A0A668AUT3_9TELE